MSVRAFHIRRAVHADAPELARLAEATFRDAYAADCAPDDLEVYVAGHFGEGHQARELSDPAMVTWLAVHGDEQEDTSPMAIGYLQLRLDAECPVREGSGPAAEVARCYVHRDWHGHGVARALMDAAVEGARRHGARLAWLSVWQHNARAVAFYHKYGFTIVGEAMFTMGSDVQPDHVMALALLP